LYPLASLIRTQSASRGSPVTPKPVVFAPRSAHMKKTTLVAGLALALGTNANKKNAFGKCVSQKAKENETEQPPAA
jgi:hypothetical protein